MAISLSIVWDKHKYLVIQDIHEKFREQVHDYIREHLCSYRLFNVLGLRNEKDIDQDIEHILQHLLENDCSIVVIDPETREIYAVALVKWMTQEWRSWTAFSLQISSPRLMDLVEMLRSTLESEAQEREAKWDSLHLFYYHIADFLKEDPCFMWRFFNAICEVARHMGMPRVTYMALSQGERDIILKENFNEIARVIYSMYIYQGRRPFDHLRDIDELYAAFYEKKVEPVKPYKELTIRYTEDKLAKDNKRFTRPDTSKSIVKLFEAVDDD